MELPCDLAILLLSIYGETQNTNLKEYMDPYVHHNIFFYSQTMEVTQVPINTQVN